MAAALIGEADLGAVLGEAFSLLFETVKDVTNKACLFEPTLKCLQSTLLSLTPIFKDIIWLSRALERRTEETKKLIDQMKKGEKLVSKCLKIQWWNYFMKPHYAGKLLELDKEISRFFWLDLQALNARTVLETLAGLNDICKHMMLSVNNSRLSCTVPRCPDYIVGLDASIKEMKMQLLKKEVPVLVLTAAGGCGKTTLVKMLCQDEEIKGTYKDNIFFVPVSKTPNLKVTVQRLFSHTGVQKLEFQSDEDAINLLEQHLKQIEDPKLLILDDVWSRSHLEKFEFRMPNYKILVTSRTAFPGFSFTYNMKPLNDKDARTLLHHSANLQDRNSSIPDKDINKILILCGGFPLAIKVIGSSLCGQFAEVWRSEVMKWSPGHSILGSNSDLLNSLEKSLAFLDDELIIKECFMDLGSFPEGQRIHVATLIDMWTELYELDEDGIHAIANLYEISARNLASLFFKRKDASDFANYYGEDYVTQHDLLRELAIHQSSQGLIEQRKRLIINIGENNLPKWWTDQKQQSLAANLLSISTDETFSSSWCNLLPAKVEVLVLNFQTEDYCLPGFVEKMDKLKALIVTNYGFFPAELGNIQLLGSLPNLKRIRLQNVSIPSIFKIPPQLRNMEKISLFMCNIGQNFRNCNIEISNAWSNLMEINIDYCNDLLEIPVWLCYIVSLKKLSVTNCRKLFALPIEIRELTSLEVLRLRACTNLSELPESITSLQNLRILDISDCLSIGKLPKHIGELRNLIEIHMAGCLRLRNPLPPSTMNLEKLKLVICDEERGKLWEPIREYFRMALSLHIDLRIAEKDINLNWLALSLHIDTRIAEKDINLNWLANRF